MAAIVPDELAPPPGAFAHREARCLSGARCHNRVMYQPRYPSSERDREQWEAELEAARKRRERAALVERARQRQHSRTFNAAIREQMPPVGEMSAGPAQSEKQRAFNDELRSVYRGTVANKIMETGWEE